MASEPITVIHLVGGLEGGGGIQSVVRSLAAGNSAATRHRIWMARGFRPAALPECHVCEGRTLRTDVGLRQDVLGALRDLGPLLRWIRTQPRVILYGHSRLGILAGCLASRLTGRPLLMHFHFLASRPGLYRFLRRWTGATPIFNSAKTCRHYGFDPATAHVVMPTIQWPEQAAGERARPARFVACGRFVGGKHFDLVIKAVEQLHWPGIELHLFGFTPEAPDAPCQAGILAAAERNPLIKVRAYDSGWAEELGANDIFVHLGQPESFGMVILEAFARGCRVVALNDTFLDDLPAPLDAAGVFRVSDADATRCAAAMRLAFDSPPSAEDYWSARRKVSDLFVIQSAASRMEGIFREPAMRR